MHIPDSMLHGTVCPVTAVASAAGVATAVYCAAKSEKKPTATRFASVTALVFALQMLNFPISGGTSGHLLGGVMAAALLGAPFAVLSIALVVGVQALAFSDGGLNVLGANIFNMAILGAGLGGMIYSTLASKMKNRLAALSVASWISVIIASISVSIQVALGGEVAFLTVLPAMVLTHAAIGVGEAFISLGCYGIAGVEMTETSSKRHVALPLGIAVVAALLLSPFASSLPDGLESVAERLGFLHDSAPAFAGIFPDYLVPNIGNEAIATGLAGLAGVAITFACAWAVSRLLARKPATVKA